MTATPEEEVADRFYLAEEYIIRQGELVSYLLDLKYVALADRAIRAVLEYLQSWDNLPWMQVQLNYAYLASRQRTKEGYRVARQ